MMVNSSIKAQSQAIVLSVEANKLSLDNIRTDVENLSDDEVEMMLEQLTAE